MAVTWRYALATCWCGHSFGRVEPTDRITVDVITIRGVTRCVNHRIQRLAPLTSGPLTGEVGPTRGAPVIGS